VTPPAGAALSAQREVAGNPKLGKNRMTDKSPGRRTGADFSGCGFRYTPYRFGNVPEPGGSEGHERHRVPGAATEKAAETARTTRRMRPATLERVRRPNPHVAMEPAETLFCL
jgi:hypothetical protein